MFDLPLHVDVLFFCAESMMKDFWLLFLNVYYQCETQPIQCSQENLRRHKSNFTSTVTERVKRKWLLVAVGHVNVRIMDGPIHRRRWLVDDTKTASVSQPYAQHRPPQAIVCFLNKFEFYCWSRSSSARLRANVYFGSTAKINSF